ncbi:MAG: SIS domain-containing protein [Phycisphaerales bacterium]
MPPDPPHLSDLAFAERVIAAESRAVSQLSARLGEPFVRAVDRLEQCARNGGTVLVSGLGKSGLIGAKISATLASLGVTSHFVHPSEAAHGDLGRFRPQDACIALSYSGETDEIVNLAAVLKQDGIPVIALTRGESGDGDESPGTSSLARLAAVVLALGTLPEETDISPAPTLSTTASLALGDALALCASRRLGFGEHDFAKRHPGGTLGVLLRPVVEALRFRVGRNLATAFDDLTVGEALRMAEAAGRRPGALLLTDRATGVLTGIFTDADLRRHVLEDPQAIARPVRSVMTRGPGTLGAEALVRDAVRMVREFRRDEIPVVDADGRPVGLLDVQDLIAMRLVKE